MMQEFHRRSIRLAGYDYSEAGEYFVTICAYQRKCIFGEIVNGVMELSEFGRIVFDQWKKIPERFGNVELGEFVIMPNHVHGIIILHDMDDLKEDELLPENDGRPNLSLRSGVHKSRQGAPVRAGLAPAPGLAAALKPAHAQEHAPSPKLGDIIGAYKSLTAMECLKIAKNRGQFLGKLWHRNYYEHIITSDEEYATIAAYIESNPSN